eukprot:TRINITY_DN7909_c0_g1_i1.p1 TRINITY_DN7909_c0_g1~~TRINITY_DN7909_c0_g1_i1.p1  ORF type:complete len:251 (+),score=30.65 TRINITY_DN7909_c0_g1_i1:86-838(+)
MWLCQQCCEEERKDAKLKVINVAAHLDEVVPETDTETPKPVDAETRPVPFLKAGNPTWQVPQIESQEPLAFIESESAEDPTFRIEIDPRLGDMELDLDKEDPDVCIVSNIHPQGFFTKWNATCQRENLVRVHYRIVSVGGRSDTTDNLLNLMRHKERVILTIERPRFKEVQIKRGPSKFGLTLGGKGSAVGVIIHKVDEALVKSLREADQIRPHDRILEVNGVPVTSADPSRYQAPELRLKLCCYSKFSL